MRTDDDTTFGLLTLNVANPSEQRAERQLEWLDGRPEHVFVLTEVGRGPGSRLLAGRLREAGWALAGTEPEGRERGVLVASRLASAAEPSSPTSYLPERAIELLLGGLAVIGAYAPSRDGSAEKIARKRRFLAELLTTLGARERNLTVLIGDLNIIEPTGSATDGLFFDWEHELYAELPRRGWLDAYRTLQPGRVELSWSDPEGRGHRFDHCFITPDLRARLRDCRYLHETRRSGLSDHSAMLIELAGLPSAPLAVDPSLAAGPPSLF